MNNSSRYTEKELFALISEGDEKAFKQLYVQLKPMLFGFIFKLTKSEDAVREIVQESLFRLWISRDKLAEIEYPRSWFFKVVSNECHHYFRKHGLQKRLIGELERQANSQYEHTTDAEIAYRETRLILQQAILKLAPRQREIYQLSRDKGFKIPQIATHLGLSEKYVKKTLMRSLFLIREELVKAGKNLPLILICLSAFPL